MSLTRRADGVLVFRRLRIYVKAGRTVGGCRSLNPAGVHARVQRSGDLEWCYSGPEWRGCCPTSPRNMLKFGERIDRQNTVREREREVFRERRPAMVLPSDFGSIILSFCLFYLNH